MTQGTRGPYLDMQFEVGGAGARVLLTHNAKVSSFAQRDQEAPPFQLY